MRTHTTHTTIAPLLLLLLLGSCTEEETTAVQQAEGQPVAFSVYVKKQHETRAGALMEMTQEALQAAGFGVYAYHTNGRAYSGANSERVNETFSDFFYNERVSYDGTKAHPWHYEPLKYWPNEYDEHSASVTGDGKDRLSFFAYAPYVAGSAERPTDAGYPTTRGITSLMPYGAADGAGYIADPHLDFAVPTRLSDGTRLQGPVDLLWGVYYNETDNSDPLNGRPWLNRTKQGVGEDIRFYFRHALTQLRVNVQTLVDPLDGTQPQDTVHTQETHFYVKRVSIGGTNLVQRATLNLNNDGTPGEPHWMNASHSTEMGDLTVAWDDKFEANDGAGTAYTAHVMNDDIRWPGPYPTTAGTFGTVGEAVDHWFEATKGLTEEQELLTMSGNLNFMTIPLFSTASTELEVTVHYAVVTRDARLLYNTPKGYSIVDNSVTQTVDFGALAAGKTLTLLLQIGATTVKFSLTDVEDWDTDIIFAPWVMPWQEETSEYDIR